MTWHVHPRGPPGQVLQDISEAHFPRTRKRTRQRRLVRDPRHLVLSVFHAVDVVLQIHRFISRFRGVQHQFFDNVGSVSGVITGPKLQKFTNFRTRFVMVTPKIPLPEEMPRWKSSEATTPRHNPTPSRARHNNPQRKRHGRTTQCAPPFPQGAQGDTNNAQKSQFNFTRGQSLDKDLYPGRFVLIELLRFELLLHFLRFLFLLFFHFFFFKFADHRFMVFLCFICLSFPLPFLKPIDSDLDVLLRIRIAPLSRSN